MKVGAGAWGINSVVLVEKSRCESVCYKGVRHKFWDKSVRSVKPAISLC